MSSAAHQLNPTPPSPIPAGVVQPIERSSILSVPVSSGRRSSIGWIGVGVMGNSMVQHLLNKVGSHYSINIFNRTAAKCEAAEKLGAKVFSSPQELAANSDIVFSMVSFPSDVRSLYLGSEGILNFLKPGSIVVDMTTSEPALAEEIEKSAMEKGIFSIDAPVSGGDAGAKNGVLSIMMGGSDSAVTAVRPLLECFGKTLTLLGPAGKGQHCKMVNQLLIASGMVGVCEGLIYAQRAGLDLNTAIAAVSSGAAGSWSISNLGPRIVAGNFDPGFFVEHFIKDLAICFAECRRMNLSLPGLSLAFSLYQSVMAHGGGKRGTHALYLAIKNMNGETVEPNLWGKK